MVLGLWLRDGSKSIEPVGGYFFIKIIISINRKGNIFRKCELTNLITCDALDEKFDEITSLFFGNDKKTAIVVSSGAPALPFRGFLHVKKYFSLFLREYFFSLDSFSSCKIKN